MLEFKSDSSLLRDWAKNYISHDISNSYCGSIMTTIGGWVGEVTRTIRFDFDPDLADHWDTKCELVNLVEGCAPTCAVVVFNISIQPTLLSLAFTFNTIHYV